MILRSIWPSNQTISEVQKGYNGAVPDYKLVSHLTVTDWLGTQDFIATSPVRRKDQTPEDDFENYDQSTLPFCSSGMSAFRWSFASRR